MQFRSPFRILILFYFVVLCSGAFGAEKGDDCNEALTRWQLMTQVDFNWNFSRTVKDPDQAAMRELVRQGFIKSGTWRRDAKELLPLMDPGYRYEIDRRYIFHFATEAKNASGRLLILFGDSLYSVEVNWNHIRLKSYVEYLKEQTDLLAKQAKESEENAVIARQIQSPAFRASGASANINMPIVAPPSVLLFPAETTLDLVIKEQLKQFIVDKSLYPNHSAEGINIKALIDAKLDARIYDYKQFKGGKFTVGSSPESDPERYSYEGPQRELELSDFEMGNHVTQWMIVVWRILTGRLWNGTELMLPYFRREIHSGDDFVELGHSRGWVVACYADRPAEKINYFEALDFIKWLNELPAIVSSGCVYNLPSDVQWEYAVRYLGLDSNGYPKYNCESLPLLEKSIDDYRSYSMNSNRSFQPVNEKQIHPNGLLEMLSNVSVWILDSKRAHSNDFAVSLFAQAGIEPMQRGRSWLRDAEDSRSDHGLGVYSEKKRSNYAGIRLVRTCGHQKL